VVGDHLVAVSASVAMAHPCHRAAAQLITVSYQSGSSWLVEVDHLAPSWRSPGSSHHDKLIVNGALALDRRYHHVQEALMASDREPSQRWQLDNGQAWMFASDRGLVRPVVLAADVPGGLADMAALVAGVDHESYSFLSALRSAGRDLVLVGYSDGNAGMVKNATAVTECVMRTIAERLGDAPLTVGGLGRGAVTTRYSLA
jgi:hypothetical protein